mgnify:CR=1 FL=1
MGPNTVVAGAIIELVATGLTSGLMAECTKDSGWIITCMEAGLTLGLMAAGMKANTSMIKSTDSAVTRGQMAGSIPEAGKMESSTERETIVRSMELRGGATGSKANVPIGSMRETNMKTTTTTTLIKNKSD